MMDKTTVTIQLPAQLYADLRSLATDEQTDPVEVIAHLVTMARQRRVTSSEGDPLFDLIGAYHSQRPLIDGIPVSEDPDLYLVAAALGERATRMHAWEIAPTRYSQGQDGRPVRRDANKGEQ
jgi:hypothetical protein